MVAKSKSLTRLNLWLWKTTAMRMNRVFMSFLFHDVINVNANLDFFPLCWTQSSFFKTNKYSLLLNLSDGTLSHLDQQSGIRCFTNRSDNPNNFMFVHCTQRLSAPIVHKILLSTTAINPTTKSCADLKLWRQCPNPSLQGLRTNYWT